LAARVRRSTGGEGVVATLVNISREGCCVRLGAPDLGAFGVGSSLEIEAGELSVCGQVVWQRGVERGVRFGLDDCEEVSKTLLHQYLASLDRPLA
jgi:hypothetical protein